MKITSIQEVSLSTSGTSDSSSITSVNTSQSIVVGTWKVSSLTGIIPAEDVTCDLYLSNSTTVNLDRVGTQGTITATVYVIEFDNSVTVQKGTFSMSDAATSDDITVSAVDLSKAFSGAFYKHGVESGSPGSDSDPETRLVANKLTTTTNLNFSREGARGTVNGHWFVVEEASNDVTLETFVKNTAGIMTQSLGSSRSVVLANTFIIGSQKTEEATYNDEAVCSIKLNSTTQLRAIDGYNTTEADTIEPYVVENPNITVQQFDLTATGTSGTQTITSVDLSRSIILPSILMQGTADSGYSNGNLDERFVELHFNSATEVGWSRGATSQNEGYTFYVIEFDEVASGIDLTIQDSSHSHSSENIVVTKEDPPTISNITPSTFDLDESFTIAGSNFGAIQGSSKIYISDASTLGGSLNEVEITSVISSWSNVSIGIILSNAGSGLQSDLDTLGPGDRYIIVERGSSDLENSYQVFTYRAKAFDLSVSSNIPSSGANTTVQLTAPSGKTTGDFGGGRIQDDENPTDSFTLDSGEYAEIEWSIEANDEAVDTETYEFRVLIGTSVPNTISETPEITIVDAPSFNLVIQDSTHNHVSENLDLIQNYDLTVAESNHNHTSENIALVHKHNLIVQDSIHNHTAENNTLSHKYSLTVQNSLHSHSAENVILSQGYTLSVDSGIHSHIVETIALQQNNILIVNSTIHSSSTESLVLVQSYVLSINSTNHNHTSESVILVQSSILVISDSNHSHSSDNLALVEDEILTVQDSSHSHSVEEIALVQDYVLSIDDTLHNHSVENTEIVQSISIVVQDSNHSHTVDNITLQQDNVLSLEGGEHVHNVQNIELTQSNVLAIDSSNHGVTSENIDIIQKSTISTDDSLHSHIPENITLGAKDVLIVQDATHNHGVENIALIQSSVLDVQDSTHSHSSEEVTLSLSVIIQSSLHGHIVDNIELGVTLTIQDSNHGHTVDNATLSQAITLSISDTVHNHYGENVELSQNFFLILQDSIHNHLSDDLVVVQEGMLSIQDSVHLHNVVEILLVTKFTTMVGKFPTGSTVTITIYDLDDDSVVVNAASASEINSTGLFKYELSGVTTPNKEFAFTMTDGITQQFGKVVFREDLLADVSYHVEESVWSVSQRQEVISWARKASDEAEQVNQKIN